MGPPSLDAARASLRGRLLRHRPLDALERAHTDAVLALVDTEPRCFSRDAYHPGHVTGSAFVLSPATGRILLHHHRRLGRWLQLGGHDDGEHDPAATALREGREESGLTDLSFLVPEILDVDVHEIPAARGEPAHQHHDVRFALSTRSPEAIRRDEGESEALAWFPLDEAERLMNEPGAARALRRLRSLLAAARG